MAGWYHTVSLLSCIAANMFVPSFQQTLLTIEPAVEITLNSFNEELGLFYMHNYCIEFL